jgi:hypothetical protein
MREPLFGGWQWCSGMRVSTLATRSHVLTLRTPLALVASDRMATPRCSL